MGIFAYFGSSPAPNTPSNAEKMVHTVADSLSQGLSVSESAASSTIPEQSDVPPKPQLNAETQITAEPKKRRFSFRPFSPAEKHHQSAHGHLMTEKEEREKVNEAFARRRILIPASDKRAKESALLVRSLIVGPPAVDSPKVTAAIAKPQLSKIKAQLMQPKSANKLIAQLRTLPAAGNTKDTGVIHAVCLSHTDAEEHELYFSKIEIEGTPAPSSFPSISTASLDKLTTMLNDMRLVSLVTAPDLGFGQPGDCEGLLAGAVPTAKTVIEGVEQITPQLLALGYATGKAVMPDHTGVYPPTDRISVLTYWWGLEVVLPPPSLVYLKNAHSICDAVMNFLSAVSLMNNGVREILPFIRYISQFIDFEFSAINAQNRGQGVVCAATWIMPAAMVPRPWDFPPPPAKNPDEEETTPPKDAIPNVPVMPFPIPHPMIPLATDEAKPAEEKNKKPEDEKAINDVKPAEDKSEGEKAVTVLATDDAKPAGEKPKDEKAVTV